MTRHVARFAQLAPLSILLAITAGVNAAAAGEDGTTRAKTALAHVYSWSARDLVQARERLAHGDPALQPALKKLERDADRDVSVRPKSVMDKPRAAPSGDKHDYLSQAPYWWPDPTKPDGKPYIRRDGRENPERNVGSDHPAWIQTSAAIETLALAYYFDRKPAYAEHAALLVRVWFLDPATRMNPNINYGQFVPGRSEGRVEGVLEFRSLTTVCDSLALLEGSGAWSADDQKSFLAWLNQYFTWLRESPLGKGEEAAVNNHGTWYDVQAAHLALVVGKPGVARDLVRSALTRRLAHQVEPDGRQPLELARTKSLNYSLLNLEGLFNLARLGDSVGVDWWQYATPDGRSLKVALDYLAPYADPGKPWPKEDVVAGDRARLFPLLAEASRHGHAPIPPALARFSPPDACWHLLWP
jgi:hypothetical protein